MDQDASQSAGDCRWVVVEPNGSTMNVSGQAPPEDYFCLRVRLEERQTLSLALEGWPNVMFSVVNVVDAQRSYEFEAGPGDIEIRIGRLVRHS